VVVAEQLAEQLEVRSLLEVVDLLGHPCAHLLEHRVQVDGAEVSRQVEEHAQVLEVALDDPVHLGYCTFTATSRPSWRRPRWTWPIEAAAQGASSSSRKASSSGISSERSPAA